MTDKNDNLAKADPAAYEAEKAKANDLRNKQTEKDRVESGERNPDATAEIHNRNIPQAKPDVTLSRTNETEQEAEEAGRKAKARGGVNNEPGMDRPVPASTPQKNDLADARRRSDGNYDRIEEDDQAYQTNENGTPKPMRAKSDDEVSCRVTKKGDGQVFRGDAGEGTYSKGDTFSVDRKIADDLEDRGFVETE